MNRSFCYLIRATHQDGCVNVLFDHVIARDDDVAIALVCDRLDALGLPPSRFLYAIEADPEITDCN